MSGRSTTVVITTIALTLATIVYFETRKMKSTSMELFPTAGGAFNNPLNIRSTAIKWGGEITQPGAVFESYESMDKGYRAALINLRIHYTRDHSDTLRKQITQWAPSADHNDPNAYTQTVTNWLKISYPDFNPDANIYEYLYSEEKTKELLWAMTFVEQGAQFAVNAEWLTNGFNLA